MRNTANDWAFIRSYVKMNSRVRTSQLCKLSTVNDLQYVAKQITALLLTCLHPLLLNRRNLVQPRASASIPFSVIESHHEMFISSKFFIFENKYSGGGSNSSHGNNGNEPKRGNKRKHYVKFEYAFPNGIHLYIKLLAMKVQGKYALFLEFLTWKTIFLAPEMWLKMHV